jgi:hypothetical protein
MFEERLCTRCRLTMRKCLQHVQASESNRHLRHANGQCSILQYVAHLELPQCDNVRDISAGTDYPSETCGIENPMRASPGGGRNIWAVLRYPRHGSAISSIQKWFSITWTAADRSLELLGENNKIDYPRAATFLVVCRMVENLGSGAARFRSIQFLARRSLI